MRQFLKRGKNVSKKKLDVALLLDNMKARKKTFTNDLAGFQNLYLWVQHHYKGDFHFCMKFTGIYDEAAAEFLYEKDQLVSRVNAMAIKPFARSNFVNGLISFSRPI